MTRQAEGSTTITLESGDNSVSLTVSKEDLTMPELMQELIVPLLLASTYHIGTIKDALSEEYREDYIEQGR